jgi:hypothetical protein
MASVTKNLRDASVVIKDGSSPPNKVILACEEGDLSFSVQDAVRRIMDRGALAHLRAGDEQPIEGSMTLKFREFYDQAAAVTPYAAIQKVDQAAAWLTTLASASGGDEVYCVDMDITINDAITANDNEMITLTKLHAENIEFSEGDEYDTLRFTFVAWITTPTVVKTSCETACEASCQTACQTGCETSAE